VWRRCGVRLVWAAALTITAAPALSAPPDALASPIGSDAQPAAPWRVALLPRQKQPATRFDVVDLDGQRVLRVRAERAYGNLLHEMVARDASLRTLRWSWRVDAAPRGDLRTKQGDDVALKVCALFDWPLERLSLADRTRLATARLLSGEALPTAVVCWVVDTSLPTGTWLDNAYTSRLRMLVVQGRDAPLHTWQDHERDLHADFRRAFADEWRDGDAMPALRAVLIGADTDNTASESLAYLRSIELR
jgi:Protein of unknown function (DUF3047)